MSDDVVVNNGLIIPDAELAWRFSTSGGPGGQHANTSNTRVEVVWDVADSAVVTDRQRSTLTRAFGPQVAVVADDTRSQVRNRQLARDRLAERVAEALTPRKRRIPSRPGRRANQRRLDAKKHRSKLKRLRRNRPDRY